MQRPVTVLLLLLAMTRPAWAHPMPNSAVVLHLGRAAIGVDLTLPIGELASGWERPLPLDSARTVQLHGEALKGYVLQHVHASAPDGRAWTVTVRQVAPSADPEPDVCVSLTLTPPPGAPVDRFTLRYDAIFHRLVTHTAIVTMAADWRNGVTSDEPDVLGTLRDTAAELIIDRSGGSWLRGTGAMFRLGARHIAEGTDHLLFLLALILPSPLVAAAGRWVGYAGGRVALRRTVRIVTAFTVGHSITLLMGVLGWANLPGALVESIIALSILVSAVGALVPVFRGREVLIAAGFGLVHGLAFASTLTGFSLDPWTMALSVLGFNLGIEAVQILVVLATLPWLVLLARTPVYGPFRAIGASLIGTAAAAWFAERALGLANPVGPLVEAAASHAAWLLVGLMVLAGVATSRKVEADSRAVLWSKDPARVAGLPVPDEWQAN